MRFSLLYKYYSTIDSICYSSSSLTWLPCHMLARAHEHEHIRTHTKHTRTLYNTHTHGCRNQDKVTMYSGRADCPLRKCIGYTIRLGRESAQTDRTSNEFGLIAVELQRGRSCANFLIRRMHRPRASRTITSTPNTITDQHGMLQLITVVAINDTI